MLIGSQELIRDINSRFILTYIINNGPISRAALAKISGLTKATISAIVQELIDKNLVIESGSDNTSRGRKPILLNFNPYCGHVIAIDLEWERLAVMTCHLQGEEKKIAHYPNKKPRDEIQEYLAAVIDEQISSLPSTPYGVIGICLAIHGMTHQNQITFMPYSPYEELDLAHYLEEYFSIPVYLENEANLSIIGEKIFCYNYANMVGISIHSGIGLGLIINHELYTGCNGNAGEFGHTIVEVNGKPCPCGNQGCFEQYASERTLLFDFMERKKLKDISFSQFIDAYKKQDIDAVALVDQFTHYMSIGINNILNMFNPDVIVINSQLVTAFPLLTDKITALLKNRMRNFCHILPSGLQDTSILLGGVCICLQGFLGLSSLNFKITPLASNFNNINNHK